MNPIIKPETINILASEYKSDSATNEIPHSEAKPEKAKWKKLKALVHEVCETLKPVLEIILPLCKAMSTLIKACGCARKGGNVAYGV